LRFNYAAHNAPAYEFNTFASSFEFNDPDSLSDTDIFVIVEHLSVFLSIFSLARG